MRKPDFCLCENKGADQLHSNCEADLRLIAFTTRIPVVEFLFFLNRNFKLLACFCDSTGRFVSDLVGNPKDRFSHVAAHLMYHHSGKGERSGIVIEHGTESRGPVLCP